MAIKMRYLYFSKKKKMAAIGEQIKQKYELQINSVDVIPPAYSCDKERVVILAITGKGEPADALRLFCREMTKLRAQNTCLIMDGDQKCADFVLGYLRDAGTNVVGQTLFINGGSLFNSKPSDAEMKTITDWVDAIIADLK